MKMFRTNKLILIIILLLLSYYCYTQDNFKSQVAKKWPFDIEIVYDDSTLMEVKVKNISSPSIFIDTISYSNYSKGIVEIGKYHHIVEDFGEGIFLQKLRKNEHFSFYPKDIKVEDSLVVAVNFIKSKCNIKQAIRELKKNKNYFSLKELRISKEIFNYACIYCVYKFYFHTPAKRNL